jgi:hypothetical protein
MINVGIWYFQPKEKSHERGAANLLYKNEEEEEKKCNSKITNN